MQAINTATRDPDEYPRAYRALPTLVSSILRHHVAQHGLDAIDGSVWAALQRATGKPTAWLFGFVAWLHDEMLAPTVPIRRHATEGLP